MPYQKISKKKPVRVIGNGLKDLFLFVLDTPLACHSRLLRVCFEQLCVCLWPYLGHLGTALGCLEQSWVCLEPILGLSWSVSGVSPGISLGVSLGFIAPRWPWNASRCTKLVQEAFEIPRNDPRMGPKTCYFSFYFEVRFLLETKPKIP